VPPAAEPVMSNVGSLGAEQNSGISMEVDSDEIPSDSDNQADPAYTTSNSIPLCRPCFKPHEICMTNLKSWSCQQVPDTTSFDWKPCNCAETNGENHRSKDHSYFEDSEDPRRLPFNKFLNYKRDNNGFHDHRVQNLYRNLQIANQIHSCCFTCFKYCLNAHICRFGYPRTLRLLLERLKKLFPSDSDDNIGDMLRNVMTTGYVLEKIDGNGRKRRRVEAPFNNAHLNNHAFSPLLMCAQHANMDCKYMESKSGTVEYIGSYISKVEQPDFVKIGNIFVKKIAGICRNGKPLTDLQKLNAVGSALIDSQVVGAPHMCFFLVGLPFVKFSRSVELINPLPRSDILIKVLSNEARQFTPVEASALNKGINSHIGKRDAYSAFLKYNQDNYGSLGKVTYFALRTSYTTKLRTLDDEDQPIQVSKSTKIQELDHLLKIDDKTGFIDLSEKSFYVGSYIFSRRRKPAVIHLSPHVPVSDMDERSAFSVLLLHHLWPTCSDKELYPADSTALKHLAELESTNSLLPHVRTLLNGIRSSELEVDNNRRDMESNKKSKLMARFGHKDMSQGKDEEDENDDDSIEVDNGKVK